MWAVSATVIPSPDCREKECQVAGSQYSALIDASKKGMAKAVSRLVAPPTSVQAQSCAPARLEGATKETIRRVYQYFRFQRHRFACVSAFLFIPFKYGIREARRVLKISKTLPFSY
jgi:hypothetical protein